MEEVFTIEGDTFDCEKIFPRPQPANANKFKTKAVAKKFLK
jgi:hypothetical protein